VGALAEAPDRNDAGSVVAQVPVAPKPGNAFDESAFPNLGTIDSALSAVLFFASAKGRK